MLEKETERKPTFRAKHMSICLESDTEKPGYQRIEVFNPSTQQNQYKWVDRYGKIGGYVNDLQWYRRKDEKSGTTFAGLHLNIVDGEFDVILDLPFGKKPYKVFVACARNIDFTRPVVFRAWEGTNDKTKKPEIAFVIEQDGENVAWYYKRGQNGLPEAVQNDLTGKWDFSRQDNFLLNDLLDNIAPLVDQCAKARGYKRTQAVSPDDDFGDDPEFEPEPPAPAIPTSKEERRAAVSRALGVQAPPVRQQAQAASSGRLYREPPPNFYDEEDEQFTPASRAHR